MSDNPKGSATWDSERGLRANPVRTHLHAVCAAKWGPAELASRDTRLHLRTSCYDLGGLAQMEQTVGTDSPSTPIAIHIGSQTLQNDDVCLSDRLFQ